MPTASGKKSQPVADLISKLSDESCRKLDAQLGVLGLALQSLTELSMWGPRYKQKAIKTVRTHIKLVTEAVKSDDMVKLLRDTAACEWKGSAYMAGSEFRGSNN